MEKKITSHFSKGLIIGLVLVIIGIIFQVLDIYDRWIQWAVLGLYCLAIIYSCILYSKEMEGDVTFGNVFGHGFKTASIVTLITIAAFIITYLIMPEIKEKAMQIARAEMEKNPKVTEEIIDNAMKMTDKFFLVFGIVGSLFSYALMGAIAALIGASIAKKTPQSGIPKNV